MLNLKVMKVLRANFNSFRQNPLFNYFGDWIQSHVNYYIIVIEFVN